MMKYCIKLVSIETQIRKLSSELQYQIAMFKSPAEFIEVNK